MSNVTKIIGMVCVVAASIVILAAAETLNDLGKIDIDLDNLKL